MPTQANLLLLKIVTAKADPVFCQIRCTTPMKKMMDAYCNNINKTRAEVRFLFGDQILDEKKTPGDYKLTSGDSIEVALSL